MAAASFLATIVAQRDAGSIGEDNTYGLPQGADIRRGLAHWYDEQKAEVLGTIKELGDALPDHLPDFSTWSDRMGDSFTPMIGAYWDDSAKETYERLGLDPDRWEVVNPHWKPQIEKLALNFCHSTNATTTRSLHSALDLLRQELAAGIVEEGESVAELTKRVQGVFEGMAKSKARQIAATEASRAFHAGQEAAAIDSDVVAGFELLLSSDACPLCRKIHDECKAVPIGRAFAVIGDNPDYSHVKFPPLHPSCQCSMIEVLKPDVGGPSEPDWGETLVDPKPKDDGDTTPPSPEPEPEPKPEPKPAPKPKPKKEPVPEPAAKVPETEPAMEVEPAKPGPKGPGVGKAIDVKAKGESGKQIAEAIKSIDAVHGDGALPTIPVVSSSSDSNMGFYARTRSNRPIEIGVSSKGEHPQNTVTHEIGHFLEKVAIPGTKDSTGQRDWTRDVVMVEWKRAVDASEAVQNLRALRGKSLTVDMGKGKTVQVPVDSKHLDYLLKYDEIWARAYAQYISVRSESESMADEFYQAFNVPRERLVNYREQWNAVDFRPIAEAIDKLFVQQGWRTS